MLNLVLKKFKVILNLKREVITEKKILKKLLRIEKIKNIQLIKKVINIWGGIILIKNNKKFYITKINDYGNISGISYYPAFIFKF